VRPTNVRISDDSGAGAGDGGSPSRSNGYFEIERPAQVAGQLWLDVEAALGEGLSGDGTRSGAG